MPVIHRVETHEGREEAHVRLGEVLAHQIGASRQAVLEPVERGPQPVICGVIGPLRSGKSASAYAVICLGEEAGPDLFHLVALLYRPPAWGPGDGKCTSAEKAV